MKEKGIVKWFNAAKGFGFIQRPSGDDVFVHFSAIKSEGYRNLEEGSEVEFEVTKGPKGLQASNVMRSSPPDQKEGGRDPRGKEPQSVEPSKKGPRSAEPRKRGPKSEELRSA